MTRSLLLATLSLLAVAATLSLIRTRSSIDNDGGHYCTNIAKSLNGTGSRFAGNIFVPADSGYATLTKQFATGAYPENTAPSVVVEAMSEEDVQAAVLFAGRCGYTVSPRSAGHSYVGTSSCNGEKGLCMQIDVSNLNDTSAEDDLLLAGPGVTLRQLADVCVENKFHIPSGECAAVTIGGHIQTGGFGLW